MKLLLVTHYYPEHLGGVEIVAGRLLNTLLQNNDLSAVWIASNTDVPPSESLKFKCYAVTTINFFEKKLQIPYPIWTLSACIKLWQSVKNSDLIHLHDYLYMGNIITFLFAKFHRKPIIITQHIGLIPYQNILLRGLLSNLNQTLGSFILSSAQQVIFISEEVKKYFVQQTDFKRSPLMIANGVDIDVFRSISSTERIHTRTKFNFSNEDKICLFVGRFVEKKGINILHQLSKLFPNVHWLFAGWGKLNPEGWNLPNVTVFKELSGQELAPLYQIADLFVLPSKGEGFPLVVQESMACGTPTMVSSEVAHAYPEAAPLMFPLKVEEADANTGGKAIAQWSAQIDYLLYRSTLLAELRPQVASFAAEHWSWEKCAQQYQTVFKNCLQQQQQSL